jgi:hypothetical protein
MNGKRTAKGVHWSATHVTHKQLSDNDGKLGFRRGRGIVVALPYFSNRHSSLGNGFASHLTTYISSAVATKLAFPSAHKMVRILVGMVGLAELSECSTQASDSDSDSSRISGTTCLLAGRYTFCFAHRILWKGPDNGVLGLLVEVARAAVFSRRHSSLCPAV